MKAETTIRGVGLGCSSPVEPPTGPSVPGQLSHARWADCLGGEPGVEAYNPSSHRAHLKKPISRPNRADSRAFAHDPDAGPARPLSQSRSGCSVDRVPRQSALVREWKGPAPSRIHESSFRQGPVKRAGQSSVAAVGLIDSMAAG